MDDTARYAAPDLTKFAAALLERAGLPADRANVVAQVLVEADLMGHTTHGLHLLAVYLRDVESGAMTRDGEPLVISDHPESVTWDGRYLPGPWLVTQALELAFARSRTLPVVTVAIRQSHHIACLAAYLRRATERGLLVLLASSDPSESAVAPFGGIRPLYTPDPLAVGIPTSGDPILIDISMSTTAMGVVGQYQRRGERLPHPWLLDNQGNPTDDPAAMYADPRGTILPLGGLDLGYKGFALGIMIEALTSALSGGGRSTHPNRWGASVFLQVIDPQAFGGREPFLREANWFAQAARETPTRPGDPPVRLPGEHGLSLRREQLEHGVALYPTILPDLQPWAEKLNIALPKEFYDATG